MTTLMALLLVASATAVVVKWVRMPYAVALVIAGLAIGISGVLPRINMTPDLVLLVFLPALLFEASWNLDIKALRRDWLSISVLATLGVVVCMFAVAAILHFAGGMNTSTALLFGAMVSATDPVSVVALFRQMGIDKRLTMILEGESLFNDGTAVVLFQIVLALVVSGGKFSVPETAGKFMLVVAGGAVLGSAMGYIASRITSAFDDHLLEITLTMVTAYGAFLIADHLKISPVIAVVAAGIVLGNYGSRTGMSATTRLAVNSFWEYAAFLVNSLLFLLIGLQVKLPLLIKYSELIGFGVLAVIVSRMLVVYGICPFVSTERLPIPDKWRHLLFWGGLRGALVMALALSLPLTFPDREAVINLTFGVVLFTLLVPGLTVDPLVRFLGMSRKDQGLSNYQHWKALAKAYKAEQITIRDMYDGGHLSERIYQALRDELNLKMDEVNRHLSELELTDANLDQLQMRQAKTQLLEQRKDYLHHLQKRGMLSEESLKELLLGCDLELDLISNEHAHGAVQQEPPKLIAQKEQEPAEPESSSD
jgi:CPA1 family monovalent cation:H+ antiporter